MINEYIENLIRNSWNKIPQQFKERAEDIVIQGDNEERRDERDKVYFCYKEINRKFQRIIDLMLIDELIIKRGFTEEEAYEIMKALGESK